MTLRSLLLRLTRAFHGPYPVLPRPLDAVSERWSALRPRVRLGVAGLAVVALAVGVQARVQAAEHRWGGAPVRVLIATEDLPVGAPATTVRRVMLPPAVVPATAVTDVPAPEAALSLALPEGAVLTTAHLDPRGPAASLDERLRAVPVAVQDGWVVTAGGWVDVWVLGAGDQLATLVARARPVLEVRSEGASTTALVGLDADEEVGAATEGLALGRLLLAHAPAPHATPTRSGSRSPTGWKGRTDSCGRCTARSRPTSNPTGRTTRRVGRPTGASRSSSRPTTRRSCPTGGLARGEGAKRLQPAASGAGIPVTATSGSWLARLSTPPSGSAAPGVSGCGSERATPGRGAR